MLLLTPANNREMKTAFREIWSLKNKTIEFGLTEPIRCKLRVEQIISYYYFVSNVGLYHIILGQGTSKYKDPRQGLFRRSAES